MTKNRKRFAQATLILVVSGCFTTLSGLLFTPASACSAMPAQDPPQKKDTEQQRQHQAILPDPVIQPAIRDMIVAARSENEKEFKTLLGLLRKESGESFERLIPQLIYYTIEAEARGGDMLEVMIAGVLTEQLEVSEGQLVHALVPYLGTGDPKVEEHVRDWLGGIEDPSSDRPSDYSYYRAFIATSVREGKELPRNLIHYMYESEPGTAVLTLMHAHVGYNPKENRPILWAEHQVADVLWKWRYRFLDRAKVEPVAAEALADLADHPQWWARLYVAEIMRQHPPFRSDDLIEVLLNDPDETVRSTILAFMDVDSE